MDSKKYIGMDVHQATISIAVMDSRGKVVMDPVMATHRCLVYTEPCWGTQNGNSSLTE
jgi:hypothetical protein